MEPQPDILERLGKVPRELGALHLAADPVPVAPSGRARVTVYLQQAFSGAVRGRLQPGALRESGEAPVGAPLELPTFPPGAALRWAFPLQLELPVAGLMLKLEAPLAPGAERIRQAWKLVETVEQPKEVRQLGGPSAGSLLGTAALMGAGLGVGVLVIPLGGAAVTTGGGRVKRHANLALPDGLLVPLVEGLPDAGAPEVEVLWAPGRELPAEVGAGLPQEAAPRPPPRTRKACRDCYAEVDIAEAERSRECPNCGAPWY